MMSNLVLIEIVKKGFQQKSMIEDCQAQFSTTQKTENRAKQEQMVL